MGLFSKKYCDVCNNKIGMLGNRKLVDGNLCKDCDRKLSPFFSERRQSRVIDILEQLTYREENWSAVSEFNVSRTLGSETKILLDEEAKKLIVTSSRRWQRENPDVLNYSQITGCNIDVEEMQQELTYQDKENNEVSYRPPRYLYSYDFYIVIHVNSPWFDEIRFRLNPNPIEIEPPPGQPSRNWRHGGAEITRKSAKYRETQARAKEILEVLQGLNAS